MFWYGLFFFTLGMLGVWLLVILYTLMVKPKGETSSTFYRVLKRSGVLLLVYVVVVIVGAMLFSTQHKKECRPDSKEVEIMTPQAEVITEYILKNGIPKSMEEIPNLPYPWEKCERESKNTEYCYFHINRNEYRTRLYVNYRNNIHIKIYNNKSETGIFIEVVQESNAINEFKIIDHFKPYSTKDDGICNPMRM